MLLPAESSGRIETVQTEGESVELKGLQTFSNYSVAVAAFTRAGAGAPDVAAARLFCMTAEDGEGEREGFDQSDLIHLIPMTLRGDSGGVAIGLD